ncbi:hypothetical protein AGLY_012507 [Aphis glycines]|uniref:Uncharacterized protein n=1 Tax=Aphis glycines TaxID=307491 RepID=A0A6G0T9V8_APHGL|nr:hypothetical protein AGLY_012507 [Aphis glycines]
MICQPSIYFSVGGEKGDLYFNNLNTSKFKFFYNYRDDAPTFVVSVFHIYDIANFRSSLSKLIDKFINILFYFHECPFAQRFWILDFGFAPMSVVSYSDVHMEMNANMDSQKSYTGRSRLEHFESRNISCSEMILVHGIFIFYILSMKPYYWNFVKVIAGPSISDLMTYRKYKNNKNIKSQKYLFMWKFSLISIDLKVKHLFYGKISKTNGKLVFIFFNLRNKYNTLYEFSLTKLLVNFVNISSILNYITFLSYNYIK